MCESWARGVQYYLTKMVYSNYWGGSTNRPNYTQFVVDLIDSNNDNANYGYSFNEGDKVEGYTMSQIETALIGCSNHIQWKNNIKNKYYNATKQHVDSLFDLWF